MLKSSQSGEIQCNHAHAYVYDRVVKLQALCFQSPLNADFTDL